MLRSLVALAVMAFPSFGQARMAIYCSGAVVAERFDTQVTPGPPARAAYTVTLFNPEGAARRLQINVMGSVLGRPNGVPVTLNANQRMVLQLGYQIMVPGTQPLRGEQLSNVTRVSCE